MKSQYQLGKMLFPVDPLPQGALPKYEWICMKNRIKECHKCELCKGRTNSVIGDGSPNSQIMVVGEAPGQNEDEQGLPFIGRSGQLLREYLSSYGLLDKCYITNICKCRPPNNRQPTEQEAFTCFPYLKEQMDIIKPKYIICVGKTAAFYVLKPAPSIDKMKMPDVRLKTFTCESDIKVFCIYHPSFIIRNPVKNKPLFDEDFGFVKKEIGL